jgi:hypothetical protein
LTKVSEAKKVLVKQTKVAYLRLKKKVLVNRLKYLRLKKFL